MRATGTQQSGATYLWLLLAVALTMAAVASTAQLYANGQKRSRLSELQWIEQQYREALQSYVNATPAGMSAEPASLEDLLRDRRYPTVRRHLRQIYAHPITNSADWELVRDGRGAVEIRGRER